MGLPMDLRGPVLVRGYDSVGSSLFERGTKSGLSTGAVQGRVGDGASALAGPECGLDNHKRASLFKTGLTLCKK